jgi:hypothetical protein
MWTGRNEVRGTLDPGRLARDPSGGRLRGLRSGPTMRVRILYGIRALDSCLARPNLGAEPETLRPGRVQASSSATHGKMAWRTQFA